MKKLYYLLIVSMSLLVSCTFPKKIDICHYDETEESWSTITIDEEKLDEHLEHGDKRVPCGYTYIPDPHWEQALLDHGIDTEGLKNQMVLTSDISGLTEVPVPELVTDLTGIEDFTSLVQLDITLTGLRELNLSGHPSLKRLILSENYTLDYIDISHTISFEAITSVRDGITRLNINGANALKSIAINENRNITAIDVSGARTLERLSVESNFNIVKINASNTPSLTNLNCDFNALVTLDLRGAVNLTSMNSSNNSTLTCISVDDAVAAAAGTGIYAAWVKDATTSYANDCSTP